MTRIKFCGLRREEDIAYVNELKPEFIGFVFYEKSKRNLSIEKAEKLRKLLDPSILACGVFVNEDPTRIQEIYERGIIEIAQLHGEESSDYIRDLRSLCPHLKLIQACIIKDKESLEKAMQSEADYLLLDSGQGSGEKFDWHLLENFSRDYFLAGGLNLENISSAITHLHPFSVDVSSGIETEGYKDYEKMKAFAGIVRSLSIV